MTRSRDYLIKHIDARAAWAQSHDACWICGWKPGQRWPHSGWFGEGVLQTHEMFSKAQAPGAWAYVENYFLVCGWCHQEVIPHISREQQLAHKFIHDMGHFALQPFRDAAEKFTGRPTRLVDEALILQGVKELLRG